MIYGANILVCTDFSSYSDIALRMAEQFRRRCEGTLHVLHVCDFPVHWGPLTEEPLQEGYPEKLESDIVSLAEKTLSKQIANNDVRGVAHVALGIPYERIHSFIMEKNISLLVLGHKGKGNTPFYLGGFATKMVASSSIPVLLAKTKPSFTRVAGLVDPSGPMKEVIAVTEELSDVMACPMEIVSLFADIAGRYVGSGRIGASTKLLSLSAEERQLVIKTIKDCIREDLRPGSKADLKVEVTVEKKLAYHLNSILTADHTDLIVMQRHLAGFLEKLIIGSETRRMMEIFDGNIFILPPNI